MARQNIQFKGLRHTPSDITGQDGDLLECVNLIHENGEMKPLEMPERTEHRGFYYNDTLVAVHNLSDGKKFVYAVYNQLNTYIHIKNEDAENNDVLINGVVGRGILNEEIKWAETIGNTLIIGTDKSTHYALYKNGAYKWLGDKLPQPIFKFDLDTIEYSSLLEKGSPRFFGTIGGDVDVPGGGMPLHLVSTDYDYPYIIAFAQKENIDRLAQWIKSTVASIEGEADTQNVFLYPFFVRYAVRLYDESYVQHSAPILLIPSTTNPLLACLEMYDFIDYHPNQSDEKQFFVAHPRVYALGAKMNYTFTGFVDENGSSVLIDDWEDIIKGVDVFVSSQVSSVDYNGLDRDYCLPDTFYNYEETAPFPQPPYNIKDFGCYYCDNSKPTLYEEYDRRLTFNQNKIIQGTTLKKYSDVPLPKIPLNKVKEKLQDVSLFYRVKRYSTSELDAIKTIKKLFHNEVENGILSRIETLPILHDDYVSRCRMTGSVNYNYNQKLVLGNIKLQAPLWYQDTKTFSSANYDLRIYFEIEKHENTVVIEYDNPLVDGVGIGEMDFGHYIYYPDPDCKRAIIRRKVQEPGSMVYSYHYFEVPMNEHTGLHGAYALMTDLKSLHESFADFVQTEEPIPSSNAERYYSLPNTIAMSSVANPFHFPATNFKDIGKTKVVGIAANTLDVSSGQWGQYPLYVFCSDGIVAVVIDGEGKFGGIQAVSADVLREPSGLSKPTLVQTGQALMFLTQRGVMMIAGTQIKCMSEAMNGRHFNPKSDLLPADSVLYDIGAVSDLITQTSDAFPFREFAASGFLAYDYAHNRVLLLNDDKYYQYVYSLNSGLWSKEIIYTDGDAIQIDGNEGGLTINKKRMVAAVNNYTELYLQDDMCRLFKTMDIPDENSNEQLYQYGYLVSRPIRFGTDEYKTLVRVLHRYTHYASNSFVKMALYGSRDGVQYGRINTLRGMSYQYFIFVVYTYLKPNERYSYMTVDFETRLTNKLR